MITKTLSRRALLRGTGGAMVALPHLNLMADKPNGSDVPKRMVCVGTNFGFVPSYFPSKTGRNYDAPELIQQLEQHREILPYFLV